MAALLDFARQHQVEAQVLDLNALIQTIIEIESKHDIYEQVTIRTDLARDCQKFKLTQLNSKLYSSTAV